MNIITIDPSLISTALVVNGKFFNYCREADAYNKSGLQKWYKLCEQYVTYRFIKYNEYVDYSDGELVKLKDYDKISDMIIDDIKSNIDMKKECAIGIEGYSYSSDAGSIIDLVTFSTLLRKKLFDQISKNITVFSPKSLKLESCKLTYPAINVGVKKPKYEYRNNDGISGGSFTKREMLLSIVENSNLTDTWANHLKSVKDEILENKTIKKPYEDLNDSALIYYILKKQHNV